MSDYVPTIDDLRTKMCYICREEESIDEPSDPPRAWTHPCQCTLIAHESCLLDWIKTAQTKPGTGSRDAMKCPQCGARYEIVHSNNGALGIAERGLWHALTQANVVVGYVGKAILILVPSTMLSVVAVGTYWTLTKYGAYAVREFFGQELYDITLSNDESRWPWTAFLNLPLIPIGLMASRFDATYSALFIGSSILEWPNFQDPYLLSLHASTDAKDKDFPLYPPSPYTVGFVLYPLVRYFYSKALKRLENWLLGPQLRTVKADVEDDPLLVVRLRGGVGDPGPDDPPANVEGNAQPAVEHNAADQTITIYASPLGRKLGGALLIPAIARQMGNLLLRLAKKDGWFSSWLRVFLAVKSSSSPTHTNFGRAVKSWFTPPSSSSLTSHNFTAGVGDGKWSFGGAEKGVTWHIVLRALWGGGSTWAQFDPVWWRNTIGFGIFVVAKDALNLLHMWLIKREIETRRIRNRNFAGVDTAGLDLISRS